jgi:FeS assembly SUF system regulator
MGKLTDYAIVLMSFFAANRQHKFSAQSLADTVKVPQPTVRKVLKLLTHSDLLKSERGAAGGYFLSRHPEHISVAEIVTAMEGPIALTECVSEETQCEQVNHCAIQTNWAHINNAVFHALDEVKLSHMLTPSIQSETSPIEFYPSSNKAGKAIQDGEIYE